MVNRTHSDEVSAQRLSSLVDGELPSTEVSEALSGWRDDPQARATWHAYQLVGDVMRAEDLAFSPGHDHAFLQALRGRLANEPVPLATVPLQQVPQAAVAGPDAAPQHVRRRTAGRHWLVAPAAVAAGFVAVAGVLVVSRVAGPGAAPVPVMAGLPASGSEVMAVSGSSMVRDARLDRYLSAHRKQANGFDSTGVAQHRVVPVDGQ